MRRRVYIFPNSELFTVRVLKNGNIKIDIPENIKELFIKNTPLAIELSIYLGEL